MISVTIVAFGIEDGDIDKQVAARTTIEICDKFKHQVEIKIIDMDVDFIKEAQKFIERRE